MNVKGEGMKYLAILLLFLGLGMAGADGDWFPWINLAGGMVLCVVAALVRRLFQEDALEKLQADRRGQDLVWHS